MGKIKGLLKNINVDSKFVFDLQRKTGKKIYLKHGNEMISANDRLHHIPKNDITSHLRELGGLFGQKFKRQNNIKGEDFVYTKQRPCHIVVVINPPSARRMDAPNWYPTIKGLVDGMTDAGIFSDDNDEVVQSITFIPGEKTADGKYLIELNLIKGKRPPIFKQLTFDEVLKADN